jgi:hypothetical protein
MGDTVPADEVGEHTQEVPLPDELERPRGAIGTPDLEALGILGTPHKVDAQVVPGGSQLSGGHLGVGTFTCHGRASRTQGQGEGKDPPTLCCALNSEHAWYS